MNFIVYFLVAMVAALSVAFGLDWMAAPMSPMPASKFELRAALPPPPPAVTVRAEPKTEAKPEVPAPVAAPPAAAPVKPVADVAAPAQIDQQPASIVANEPAAAQPPAPRCDVDACASAYRSFTPADCTYQPSDGPRRLCTKGTPPAAAAPAAAAATAPEARAQACNIVACSQSYPRSFNAADCTFQPLDGPRRVCSK